MAFYQLLRTWLEATARGRLRMAVTEAARRGISGQQEALRQNAPQEGRGHVGVVFALSIESGGLEDLLSSVVTTRGHSFVAKQGRLQEHTFTLLEAGAGPKAAAVATEALIAGHRPAWVVSAGFAGGLAPQVQRYDLVVADSLVDEQGHAMTLDLQGNSALFDQIPGLHVGRLVTVDRIVRLPAEKRALGDRTQALAVDMESYAVAEVCRQRQVPFLAIRVITDPVDEQLPGDIERLLRQKTSMSRLGAALGTALQRPGSLKDMYQLREHSLIASDRLAKVLAATAQQLKP